MTSIVVIYRYKYVSIHKRDIVGLVSSVYCSGSYEDSWIHSEHIYWEPSMAGSAVWTKIKKSEQVTLLISVDNILNISNESDPFKFLSSKSR